MSIPRRGYDLVGWFAIWLAARFVEQDVHMRDLARKIVAMRK